MTQETSDFANHSTSLTEERLRHGVRKLPKDDGADPARAGGEGMGPLVGRPDGQDIVAGMDLGYEFLQLGKLTNNDEHDNSVTGTK